MQREYYVQNGAHREVDLLFTANCTYHLLNSFREGLSYFSIFQSKRVIFYNLFLRRTVHVT